LREGSAESEEKKLEIVDYSNKQEGALDKFFEALEETEQTGKKVRIAYFGDSVIEGDLITQDLRKSLQKRRKRLQKEIRFRSSSAPASMT
jgi:hypothetical protein